MSPRGQQTSKQTVANFEHLEYGAFLMERGHPGSTRMMLCRTLEVPVDDVTVDGFAFIEIS